MNKFGLVGASTKILILIIFELLQVKIGYYTESSGPCNRQTHDPQIFHEIEKLRSILKIKGERLIMTFMLNQNNCLEIIFTFHTRQLYYNIIIIYTVNIKYSVTSLKEDIINSVVKIYLF